MAKIKVCLDTACTRYYELDDGRCVHVPKDVCDVETFKKNPQSMVDFKARVNAMMRGTTKIVFMSDDPGWKEGDEATL